jgi:galactoside O-acetyltransferase
MKSDFLDDDALRAMGFGHLGVGVRISRHALCLSPERMTIGDHTRIDAFAVLSPGVEGLCIGRNVHVSAHVSILGHAGVVIGDFATLSVRCAIFSSNDDYSGHAMSNPTVPDAYRVVHDARVVIGAHAILGCGCVVLPGVEIGESACVGALSLVKTSVDAFDAVAGTPCRRIGRRQDHHRRLHEALLVAERLTPPS